MKQFVPDETAMQVLGRRLVGRPGVVYLQGELGTGKTTLVRCLLHGLGYRDTVRSPTYTLVERYPLDGLSIYHLDLYRLGDPGEVEWLGIRDLLDEDVLLLVEWPERGAGVLPPADLVIELAYREGGGRVVTLQALSGPGREMTARLTQ
ncbi:MAG: tRNA (adenosine(37)-N6)-threonylcarbamoyltransferase complex ATPase subunit type 1 TsaE [Gammaproteobacteria bacterium]